jgi:hypothetical protein
MAWAICSLGGTDILIHKPRLVDNYIVGLNVWIVRDRDSRPPEFLPPTVRIVLLASLWPELEWI